MHIGLFTDFYAPHQGGVESSVAIYKKSLEAAGYRVTIVCPTYPSLESNQPSELRLKVIPKLIIDEHPQVVPNRYNRQLLEKQQFDIVHSQSQGVVGLLGLSYAKRHKIPYFITYHFNTAEWTRILPRTLSKYVESKFVQAWFTHQAKRLGLREVKVQQPPAKHYELWQWQRMLLVAQYASSIVVPSTHFLEDLKIHFPDANYSLIPNAIDISLYEPKFSSADKTIHFLWAGRVSAEKRPMEFLEAVKTLKTKSKNFDVDFVGTGPELAKVRAFVATHNLSNVRIHGGMPYSEMPKFYDQSDVLVMSSFGVENQPMVIAEASAAGLPIVLCDPRLVNQIAPNGLFLAEDAASASLAAAMQKAMQKKSLKKSVSIIAYAKQNYDLSVLAKRLDKLYKTALRTI